MRKIFLIAILVVSSTASASETTAPTWTQWEQALTSSREYGNPFADVMVSMECQGPNGESYSAGSFWDGEAMFKIRAMFPVAGRWTWRTTCSDPTNTGLHHQFTQHPGTGSGAAKHYHGKAVLDFTGLQTGAGWGSKPPSAATASRTAVEWSTLIYHLQPPKPFINLEARYDSGFNQNQLPRLPRSCGYWTILSGAAGYTYGCAGLWNWGGCFADKDPQAGPWDWREGLNQPSSTEMMHMAEFFGKLQWWRLEPCPELIRDQPEEPTLRMVMAKTAKGDLAVAYLPDNPSLRIDMRPFPTPMHTRWQNPKTGAQLPGETIPNAGERKFSRPAGWEDALLVLFAGVESAAER